MTAVEWLIQELRGTDDKGDFIFQGVINSELIEKAKRMEKEQMIEMHDKGFDSVEQLNDEFAIEFAEWCLKIRFEPIENVSVKKLLEIYKKDNL
jgi:hypothetical protein